MPASTPTCGMTQPITNAAFFPSSIAVYPNFESTNFTNASPNICSNVPQIVSNVTTPLAPNLRIIEQPAKKARFRYKSETGSHGALKGANTESKKSCFPKVKLENCNSKRPIIISASLYTDEVPPKLHVHQFTGCKDGICKVPLGKEMIAEFSKLNIIYSKGNEASEVIFNRKVAEFTDQPLLISREDKKRLMAEAKEEVKKINLTSVRICFQAFYDDQISCNKEVCAPVFSNPILHQNSLSCADLKITRISKVCGLVTGNEEIFLLCDKFDKKNIRVKFEQINENGEIWEADGIFSDADVHHQYAIVFKTPPYWNTDIAYGVDVDLFLYRPSDQSRSKEIKFQYIPLDKDIEGTSRKRKKINSFEDFHGSPQPSSSSDYLSSNEFSPQFTNTSPSFYSSSGMSGHFTGSQTTYDSNNELLTSPSADESSMDQTGDQQLNVSDFTHLINDCLEQLEDQPEDVLINDPLLSESSCYIEGQMAKYEVDSIASHDTIGVVSKKNDSIEEITTAFQSQLSLHPHTSTSDKGKSDFLRDLVVKGDLTKLVETLYKCIHLSDSARNNLFHLVILHKGEQTVLIKKLLQLSLGVTKQLLNMKNRTNQTPVHLAVIRNYAAVLDLLLNHGGNPNIINDVGDTAVHLAVKYKCLDSLKILLGAKSKLRVNVNVTNYEGLTPLHCAIISQSETYIRLLCEAGADASIIDRKSGKTALHIACECFPNIMKYLVLESSIKVDVDAQDYIGNTPLHIASSKKLPEVVQVLMKAEANPLVENYSADESDDCEASKKHTGKTPLDLAEGNIEIIEILAGMRISSHSTDFKAGKAEDCLSSKLSDSENVIHTDSGFISSESISFMDDTTIKQLSTLLDPPENGWKQLALFLGFDDELIDGLQKLDKSPTKQIIKTLQENDRELIELQAALQTAGLTDAYLVVRNYLDIK